MNKYNVGDILLCTGSNPFAKVEVVKVSTWEKILKLEMSKTTYCYLCKSSSWLENKWIGECILEKIE